MGFPGLYKPKGVATMEKVYYYLRFGTTRIYLLKMNEKFFMLAFVVTFSGIPKFGDPIFDNLRKATILVILILELYNILVRSESPQVKQSLICSI